MSQTALAATDNTPAKDDTPDDLAALRRDLNIDATLLGHELSLHSTWGLFSPRQIDAGTMLLLNHVSLAEETAVLDVGCGYGPLGLALAAQCPQAAVHMVDKDFVAVDYAQANAQRNRLVNAQAYLSNGLSHVPGEMTFSTVVSNIPAKVGKELLFLMLKEIEHRLQPGGQLVVVTVNGLRQYIKRNFNEVFGNYQKLKQGKDYTVARAHKPHAL